MSVTREMAGEEMAFRWFGESWHAPVNDHTQQEVTPRVGGILVLGSAAKGAQWLSSLLFRR